MTDSIVLEGTEETPSVKIIPAEGIFEISGRSLPENALEFFEPVLAFLNQISANPTSINAYNFKFEYFNSSSAKQILVILSKIKVIAEKNPSIIINWHYSADDTDIRESGEKYIRLVDHPINIIED